MNTVPWPNKNHDSQKNFKQFKSKQEFHSFFNSLFKHGVEEMLKAELDEYLGYEKHSPESRNSGNSRNASYKKKVKTVTLGVYHKYHRKS
uniref:transposase n=1 Tax=Chitinophaga pinensis TaxID=79329 RepID=UPI00165191FC|nr:transposase [Chitinophaga pinensis]